MLLPLPLVVAVTILRRLWPRWKQRSWWAWGFAAAFLLWPLLTRGGLWVLGPVAAGLGLAMAMKMVDVQAGRVTAVTIESWWRFAVWFVVPPRTQWEALPVARGILRTIGLARLARGCLKAAGLCFLLYLDARHRWSWPLAAWAAAFEMYFMVSGLSDFVTGATSLLGFSTQEVFRAPFLASSPADFWGHRWNLFVSDFFRRRLFLPLANGNHVYRGAFAVFLASGLAHEYFVFVCVKPAEFLPGYMTAFFLLQGLAVMAGTWTKAHLRPVRFAPRWVKVGLHLFWLAATVWLFLEPIDPVVVSFERTIVNLF